jgi:hypothetical protein
MESKILPALVVAVDKQQVAVICPFCGRFHWHGSGGDNTKSKYGTRVPHCTEDAARYDSHFNDYELITSENTIRREKILPKDLNEWKASQLIVRKAVEERWKLQEEADRDERILKTVRDISRMERWFISDAAMVAPIHVTRWMSRHGIYYEDGQYRVVFASKAGPELCEIFGKYEDKK